MAQKTNLNVSPYFDDFNPTNENYKILFAPGRAVQARELNNLQSQIQYQIEKFGSHFFKDGSVVIPGGVTYDSRFYAVKLNDLQFGIDISVYINNYIGKKIFGRSSGVGAVVDYVAFPEDNDEVEYVTLYVKYIESGNNNEISQFLDGEEFFSEEDITFGNSLITGETTFATAIEVDATAVGSAAHINRGIYFVRGFFAEILKQTIILDYYTNSPSYKIGFTVNETIITAKQDTTLYDNAKGFTNFAAPGADRFSISLTLDKRPIDDLGDPNFVELMRTDAGEVKKEDTTTQYSVIRDYIARRTSEESGDYSVEPFEAELFESLNDYEGNNGLFFDDQTTDQGNVPSKELSCLKISPGIAYVNGYDITKTFSTIIDIEKPRDTENDDNVSILFKMGNYIRVNNVSGSPYLRSAIELHDRRKDALAATSAPASSVQIGDARLYTFDLENSSYVDGSTSWDMYLYDIQTYTEIILNESVDSNQVPDTSYIKGASSSASGYATTSGSGDTIYLRQTSGSFQEGERIIINGVQTISRTIVNVREYTIEDVKSIYRDDDANLLSFSADLVLESRNLRGFGNDAEFFLTPAGEITSPGGFFNKTRVGDIISYQADGDDVHYNRVSSVASDLTSIQVEALPLGVTNVCDETVGVAVTTRLSLKLRTAKIESYEDRPLYAELPSENISSVDLSGSVLTFKAQTPADITFTNGGSTLDSSNFNISSGIATASFLGFNEERYSIYKNDRTIIPLNSDQVSINQNQITFSNLNSGVTFDADTVIATLAKTGIRSKVKVYNKSRIVDYVYSKYPQSGSDENNSIDDGLEYKSTYGLRVQDEEICLGYPDVARLICVYESLNNDSPKLDQLAFSSLYNVSNNAIIGEKIIGETSGASARIVRKSISLPNNLEFVYLNNNTFISGENVRFLDSEINAPIVNIVIGEYKDVTTRFRLESKQSTQYYDYSRLIRKRGESEPTKKLTVIFDHYIVPENDNGDVFTVLSYPKDQYQEYIPRIGERNILASDVLDFRPRVSPITDFSLQTTSPFDFSSRNFSTSPNNLILAPDEITILNSQYYIGRVDQLYLNRNGEFAVKSGASENDGMLLSTLTYPPYLDRSRQATIVAEENIRYTMKDIADLDSRLENLERITSLSLLEVNTESLQIRDADGFNQFKTGFFVDNFDGDDFIDTNLSSIEIDDGILFPFKNETTIPNVAETVFAQNETFDGVELDDVYGYKSKDNNIKYKGNSVNFETPSSFTLDYTNTKWIDQPIATRTENVNPFHVTEYAGSITLSPEEDVWVRTTLRLPARVIRRTTRVRFTRTGRTRTSEQRQSILQARPRDRRSIINSIRRNNATTSTTSSVRNTIATEDERWIRSRNVKFDAVNLKPFTRHYQFLDNQSRVNYVPKIIEINLDSGSFEIGEIVDGYIIDTITNDSKKSGPSSRRIISFRLSQPNHKRGRFDNPADIFESNPYDRGIELPSNYSSTLQYLNVDIDTLASEASGIYSGYLSQYVQFVGRTSAAVAYLKDNRLVTDGRGDLLGTFFIEDPNTSPAPNVRISTGTKTYKLTSSKTNEDELPQSADISSGESIYTATGTLNIEQDETTITRIRRRRRRRRGGGRRSGTSGGPRPRTAATQAFINFLRSRRVDPLAQSFEVGRESQSPQNQNSNLDKISDDQGAFLTAVDIYFKSVDAGNSPITIQVRSMELGTPTLFLVGNSVTLSPNQIVPGNGGKRLKELTSEDASVPCKVVFPNPIYLPPDDEYAIVLLAPESIGYEVFIAEMNESSLNEEFLTGLPESEKVKYSKQFGIGSLFKSQNGSIWTADQNQDLKFTLYKARFSSVGTAIFTNPEIDEFSSPSYFGDLQSDPIEIYPKKLIVGITTTSINNPVFSSGITTGRKITQSNKTYTYGYVEDFGGPADSVGIVTGGLRYATSSNVDTFNINGSGSGLQLDITSTGDVITSATVSVGSSGVGYKQGDVIGIVTSSVSGNSGFGAEFSIDSITSYNALYLTNVQAEEFVSGETIDYFDGSGSSTLAITDYQGLIDPIYAGNIAKVNHFAHGMYSTANKVKIGGLKSDVSPTKTTDFIDSNSVAINVEDSSNFQTFENQPVSGSNLGYVLIGGEIIRYNGVTVGAPGALTGIERGIDSTISIGYEVGQVVTKYELGGVSLRRLNASLEVADIPTSLDHYYIEFNRDDATGSTNRINDGSTPSLPQLSFKSGSLIGGNLVSASQNILYSEISPLYGVFVPGGNEVDVVASSRMVTGTSVGGNETSFLDLGFTPIELNSVNEFNRVRLVASRVNEEEYLTELPNSKSFTTAITLTSQNPNLSPQIFIENSVTNFGLYRLNDPVSNYIIDRRSNEIDDSSHSATYVSTIVSLEQASTSLKVILSAYRHSSADFRVLYSLIHADSFEVDQSFNLFPGYNNLRIDRNQDGFLDVIDPSKNSGLPDAIVPFSNEDEFLEYEYTAADLPEFVGFVIKIVMSGKNQAKPPKFENIRAIALA